MGTWFLAWNQKVQELVWGTPMLVLFLGTGLWFSVRSRFFQIRGWKKIRRWTWAAEKSESSHSGFQSLCKALAGTLGTGNIAGVATALAAGGPGALFWMWISALVGMMTGYAEKYLGAKYAGEDPAPLAYIRAAFRSKAPAYGYAALCAAATLGAGNLVQTNSVAEAAEAAMGIPGFVTAVLLAGPVWLVTVGGEKRISGLMEHLIPALTVLYLAGCLTALVLWRDRLLPVFGEIFRSAFGWRAGIAGTAGYTMQQSLRMGASRGVFSNEAGMGSSVLAYDRVGRTKPCEQGAWGILEVFVDTILMCTMTGLVLLCSQSYDPAQYAAALAQGTAETLPNGAALAGAAFSEVFGRAGQWFLAAALYLFAFPSIVCWCYYGSTCVQWMLGRGAERIYRNCFVGMILVGSFLPLSVLWNLADSFNGLMAIPNLAALLLLSGQVRFGEACEEKIYEQKGVCYNKPMRGSKRDLRFWKNRRRGQ
ncbi:MAG: amino acid carrier protein [Lachnospiraceae bacterium]|nr:amino acid carrier protein [Lachnospiraceae bacterium]